MFKFYHPIHSYIFTRNKMILSSDAKSIAVYLQKAYYVKEKKFKTLALLDKNVAAIGWNFHISLLLFLDIFLPLT